MRYSGNPQEWLENIVMKYKSEEEVLSPPQLCVASWLVSAVCTNIAFDIATNMPIKLFPDFYFTSVK